MKLKTEPFEEDDKQTLTLDVHIHDSIAYLQTYPYTLKNQDIYESPFPNSNTPFAHKPQEGKSAILFKSCKKGRLMILHGIIRPKIFDIVRKLSVNYLLKFRINF
jgi:hypothetical protein